MQRLKENYEKKYGVTEQPVVKPKVKKDTNSSNIIIFEDISKGISFRFSQCCNPLPGDDIVGFITRGHGISIHKVSCTNYQSALARDNNMERWKKVSWSTNVKTEFHTAIEVIAVDRTGLLQEIVTIISEARIAIYNSSSRRLKDGNASIKTTIAINGVDQLDSLIARIKKVNDVLSVTRIESRRGIW